VGRRLDLERSVGVAQAGAIGDGGMWAESTIIAERRECGSDIADVGEFPDGHFQLTSTPTQSVTISNETRFVWEAGMIHRQWRIQERGVGAIAPP